MKIAVTAQQPLLDAELDPRFGRCPYFLIVDTDNFDFEAVENPNMMLGGGAGIQSAQLMADKGVKCVLTGNCGPNAYQTLSAVGIEVIVGCSGVVRDVVEQLKANRLQAADAPNVASHFGTGAASAQNQTASTPQTPVGNPPVGPGRGGGMGGGGGRGMGMGRGMGRGRGMGQGMGGVTPASGAAPNLQPPQQISKEEELDALKQQAEIMAQQMQQMQERIRQLEEED